MTVISARINKARKSYECFQCGKKIKMGQYYLRVFHNSYIVTPQDWLECLEHTDLLQEDNKRIIEAFEKHYKDNITLITTGQPKEEFVMTNELDYQCPMCQSPKGQECVSVIGAVLFPGTYTDILLEFHRERTELIGNDPNLCSECGGKSVLFRGENFDMEHYICSQWETPGHLSEDEIIAKITSKRAA